MKKTKILICLFVAAVMSGFNALSAQDTTAVQQVVVPEGFELVDSLVYRPASAVDTLLAGKNILDIMPKKDSGDVATVNVYQSDTLTASVMEHVAANATRTLNGYRVRIFFDNKQTARTESEKTLKKFEQMFPDILAYRTYTNPYFKVTVGDCRTKSEAMVLLGRVKKDFPSAFVVKENIKYPVVDKSHVYDIDTVQVLRPIPQQ